MSLIFNNQQDYNLVCLWSSTTNNTKTNTISNHQQSTDTVSDYQQSTILKPVLSPIINNQLILSPIINNQQYQNQYYLQSSTINKITTDTVSDHQQSTKL